MSGVCEWLTADSEPDCLGYAGESESQSLAQAAIQNPLSHHGQSSAESSSSPHCRKINDSIFELHAPTSGRAEMEILFFHGLQLEGTSDPHISTWLSRSAQKAVWPGQWLSKDFPKARILSVSYDGSLKQDDTSGRMDMYLVAENLLDNCLLANLGQLSPVILVGHCFGGLVIKQLCVFAHRGISDRPEVNRFFENVRGIFYFATPHHGSHFASAIEKLSSKEGELLSHVKVLSKDLARLNSEFSDIPRQWLVSGLGEALPTKLGSEFNDVVVEEGSARCENFFILQENHISICQPEARDSTAYQQLSNFIQRVQQKVHLSNFIRRVQPKFTGESYSYPFTTIRGGQTYVPIHTQARDSIINGLENEQGPAVILLHGDPGSGKSVLARFIGESYARSYGEAADSESIFLSVQRISPKLVIFLDCGQTAVSTQLLQKLHEMLHPQVHRSQDQCGNGSMCTLQFLLMGRRIIVVLDDVWNPELIEAFLEKIRGCRGAHVKILVTSRSSDLSDDPEVLKVKTEEVTYTQAEKILASHLGLASISQNLQKYAEILVKKSGRHPLALAMVACRITRDRREDPKQWKAVANSYTALLRQELHAVLVRQGKQVMSFGSVLHCAYKRSIGETLMLTYKDLKPDARYLLLLVGKSGPSSVPSPVVRILFAYGVANHHKYSEPELLRFALNDLENNGAMLRLSKRILERDIPCNSASFDDEQFSYESFGLHDLQKEFLNVLVEGDTECLIKSLVPDTHCSVSLEDSKKLTSEELDRAIIWILCILWFQQDLAERAAEKLGVSLPLFGSLSIPVLRDALEPLTWLMHEAFGEEMYRCAKQVMVLCFVYGEFRKALLEVPNTVPRLVKFLVNSNDNCLLFHVSKILITLSWNDLYVDVMGTTESRYNLDVQHQVGRTPGAIPKLLTLLASEDPPNLQSKAGWLLNVLITQQENCKVLLEVPDTVERLVKLLVNSDDDDLLFDVTGILFHLSRANTDIQHQVGGTPGVIPKLVTVMSSEDPRNCQDNASGLLNELSNHQGNCKALLEVPDTVAWLVKLLVNSGDDYVLLNVAGILFNLAKANPDIKDQVRGTPGVVSKLVTVLFSENPRNGLSNASGLLNELITKQENCKALLEIPGTVERLAKLFVNSCDNDLLFDVTGILFSLLRAYSDIQYQVGGFPGVILKLVKVLSSKYPRNVQDNASGLLNGLSNQQENCKALLEVPYIVARLLKLIVNSDDDYVLLNVVGILFNLSMVNPDILHQIRRTSGVIPKLVIVLSSEDPCYPQSFASGLLNELSNQRRNCKALLEVPDIVVRLVTLLVNSDDDDVLLNVAGILCNLSVANPDILYQVGVTSGVIPKLLTLLSSKAPRDDQDNASRLLRVLSENCKVLLELEIRDIVERLVTLLVNSGNDDVLLNVAGILYNLSVVNLDILHQVGGTSGVVPKLLTLMSSKATRDDQDNASALLNVLTLQQENCKALLELALLEVPDIVERLVKLLVNIGDGAVLGNVAGILLNLSRANPDTQHQVRRTPGAIPKLLALMSSEDPYNCQDNASGLLNELSNQQKNCKALLKVPDTVARLVKLLVNSGNDDVSLNVVGILYKLSVANLDILHQVGGTSGVVPKLLTLMSSKATRDDQDNASALLGILSLQEENCKALLEIPDIVEQLVKLLVKSFRAVQIFFNLSNVNPDILHQVGRTSGVIPKLVTLLSSEDDRYNASVLLNILTLHQENCKTLLEVPDIVERLVKLLVNSGDDDVSSHVAGKFYDSDDDSGDNDSGDDDSDIDSGDHGLSSHAAGKFYDSDDYNSDDYVSSHAAWKLFNLSSHVAGIFVNLSETNPDIQHQVGGTLGMIPKLVTLMSSEDPCDDQYNASALLTVLTLQQENCKALLEVPDIVERLVQLLVNIGTGDDAVLRNVAGILLNLTRGNPDIQHQIGGTPGMISKLVTILEDPSNDHNCYNASALLYVLSTQQENSNVVLEVPDFVERLVKLFVNSDESDDDYFFDDVTGILSALSVRNPDIPHQVGGTSGVIPKLVTVLCSEDHQNYHFSASELLQALTGLSSEKQENCEAVLEVPDAVEQLVKFLVNRDFDDCFSSVASVLWSLSMANPDVQYQVGRTPGVIPKLVSVLCYEIPHEGNASFLLNVLCKCEDNRKLLSGTPGAVEELVRLSVSSCTFEHHPQLLEILCYLSEGNPNNQSRIGRTPGAISSLLTILFCVDSSSVRLDVSELLFRLSSFQANRKLFLELPEGLEELVKLFVSSERVELLRNLAGVLNNLLEEDPALESQIGEIMSSSPRRRTSRNLYYASWYKELSLGLLQAMHYEYILFCLRFGFGVKKSLFFPGRFGSM